MIEYLRRNRSIYTRARNTEKSYCSFFFFSSRRRHTRYWRDWSSDVCSSDLPPAYPADSHVVRDAEEARLAVRRFAGQGASAFKVYFRLPVGLIRAVCEEAHRLGLPVTSHLEIVDAGEAIRAGVDGVEHVTSFGPALLPAREAEKYRQSVIKDNAARREGRYEVWSRADLAGPRARAVLAL